MFKNIHLTNINQLQPIENEIQT